MTCLCASVSVCELLALRRFSAADAAGMVCVCAFLLAYVLVCKCFIYVRVCLLVLVLRELICIELILNFSICFQEKLLSHATGKYFAAPK